MSQYYARSTISRRNRRFVMAAMWSFPRNAKRCYGALRALVSNNDQERSALFSREELGRRFLFDRAVVRVLLASWFQCGAQDIAIKYGARGKPYCAAPPSSQNIAFNISHSDICSVLAVGVNIDVGVDVEKMRMLKHLHSVTKFAEIYPVHQSINSGKRFIASWARRESLIKLAGGSIVEMVGEALLPTAEQPLHIQGIFPAAIRQAINSSHYTITEWQYGAYRYALAVDTIKACPIYRFKIDPMLLLRRQMTMETDV